MGKGWGDGKPNLGGTTGVPSRPIDARGFILQRSPATLKLYLAKAIRIQAASWIRAEDAHAESILAKMIQCARTGGV